jgi:hypothetical protein
MTTIPARGIIRVFRRGGRHGRVAVLLLSVAFKDDAPRVRLDALL